MMSVLRIEGGRPLSGEIEVGGSKNAVLAILASLPLIDGITTLTNVPDISDVAIKLSLLEEFGVRHERSGNTLKIDTRNLKSYRPGEDAIRPIRTSFYLLGPLLMRLGEVWLPKPGGCDIGNRPVDIHVMGLEKMGAVLELEGPTYHATNGSDMEGAELHLHFPSAGATQHLMATACLVPGNTIIRNAAMEPEVVELGNFLKRAGAKIEGVGTSVITIQGVDRLHGCEYRVPEDRIQAGTYLIAGVITGGKVKVKGIYPEYQSALVQKMQEAGVVVRQDSDWIEAEGGHQLHGVKIKTMPHPGFPTDIQQPMASLLCLADGVSRIEETIYEHRIGHISQLSRMGAKIEAVGSDSLIEGVGQLTGATVTASDLRAGAALVMAGLAAKGVTLIHNIHFIDRGYERFEETLNQLGAQVERLPGDAILA